MGNTLKPSRAAKNEFPHKSQAVCCASLWVVERSYLASHTNFRLTLSAYHSVLALCIASQIDTQPALVVFWLRVCCDPSCALLSGTAAVCPHCAHQCGAACTSLRHTVHFVRHCTKGGWGGREEERARGERERERERERSQWSQR